MHSAKGGRRAEGKRVAFRPVLQFLCPWYPHNMGGRVREDASRLPLWVKRDLRPLAMVGRSDDQAHLGGLQLLTTSMVQDP